MLYGIFVGMFVCSVATARYDFNSETSSELSAIPPRRVSGWFVLSGDADNNNVRHDALTAVNSGINSEDDNGSKIFSSYTYPFNGPLSGTTEVSVSWAICKSAPRSKQKPRQHPTIQSFTGRMPFLPPNQQRQSIEGRYGFSC